MTQDAPAAPAHWEADVLLRDGRTAHIRPIGPEDAELLLRAHAFSAGRTVRDVAKDVVARRLDFSKRSAD